AEPPGALKGGKERADSPFETESTMHS
ncbi:hypothetical protein LCGC14_2582280, partial [marine sediment metagenome]